MGGVRIGKARTGAVLIVPLLFYTLILHLPLLFPGFFGDDKFVELFSAPYMVFVAAVLLYLPLVLVFLRWVGDIRPPDIGIVWSLHREGTRQLLLLTGKIIGTVFLILAFAVNALHQWGLHLQFKPMETAVMDLSLFILPFPEELIFRGILCTVISRSLGWAPTILISGTLFGLIHIDPGYRTAFGVASATAGGLFLSWIFYKTRTLIMPIVWHIAGNGILTLIDFYPTLWDRFAKLVTF